jgi:hypothetical protein
MLTPRPSNVSSRIYRRICCFVLFFVAAAASFGGFYQKWHFAEADVPGDDPPARIEGMLDGTAARRTVYRQMLPMTANWLDRVAPVATKRWLEKEQAAEDKPIFAISTSSTANDPRYEFRYFVIYVLTFLFSLLAVYAMFLVCCALEMPVASAVFAPVILMLLLPYIMVNGGFFYDYPELAFFSLAVWASLRLRWWWLIPIVALGSWNKETFLCFLPTLYPLLRRTGSRKAVVQRMSVLALVSMAVVLPIIWHFAHNPNQDSDLWWQRQLHFLLSAHNLFYATDETYGVRSLAAFTLLPLGLMVWTVIRGWRLLPRAMQQHAAIAAAINLPIYIVSCNPGELRNLSMLYITLLVLIAVNLNQACEGDAVLGGVPASE